MRFIKMLRPLAILAGFLCLAGVASAAAADKTMKDGKKGEIKIDQVVTVGDLTLQPGIYIVQHRVTDGQHLMHFTPKDQPETDLTAPVQCDRSSKHRWLSSQVWLTAKGNGKQIEKILLKDEKVAYNFQ